jgi:hypothetical protein
MAAKDLVVTRRTALRIGAVAALTAAAVAAPSTALAATRPRTADTLPDVDPNVPRYRFDPVSFRPDLAPLHRLEEVWASPAYMTITDCVVTYIGEETFRLTPEEQAIVAVAEQAGAVVDDPETTYRLILAVSTRVDPARLEAKLAEVGRPVVEASLVLAPEAPQAARFAAWLAATG